MRLADWVISCSLEINNACLRYLAESQVRGAAAVCAEPEDVNFDIQAIYTESLLARDSRKLLSHWRLMNDVLEADAPVEAHLARLQTIVERLTIDPAPMRLAMRLASQAAEDEDAQLMLKLGRALPPPNGPEWSTLNELFTDDSALWREGQRFAGIDDEKLSQRVGRNYRRAYKIYKRFPSRDWPDAELDKTQQEDLDQLAEYVQLASHHMELLRSALSDKQKQQLWYIDKLANALRMRQGLLALCAASRDDIGLPKKIAKQARKYLAGQERKVNKRVLRLFEGAFTMKHKKFSRQLAAAAGELGLSSVSLVERPQSLVEEPRALVERPQSLVEEPQALVEEPQALVADVSVEANSAEDEQLNAADHR